MNDILKTLSLIGIVPVITIDDPEKAAPLGEALRAGGLPAAEITLRTTAGLEAIKRMSAECPDVIVGAGTVLTVEQCRMAIEAGAKFIVSPGYNEHVVKCCLEAGVPVLPGCSNASDMTMAVNAGLEVVKFFPAEQAGGIDYIKSLAPVFPLKFMPTGGVNARNMTDYLGFDKITCCGGTWMAKKDMIENERWDEITALCREAVRTMLGFSLAHVGINCADGSSALDLAASISAVFDMAVKDGNSSAFASTAVECMKGNGAGLHGHIGFFTNNIERAVYHLEQRGLSFDRGTSKYGSKGELKAVYLTGEYGGFTMHLVQK